MIIAITVVMNLVMMINNGGHVDIVDGGRLKVRLTRVMLIVVVVVMIAIMMANDECKINNTNNGDDVRY